MLCMKQCDWKSLPSCFKHRLKIESRLTRRGKQASTINEYTWSNYHWHLLTSASFPSLEQGVTTVARSRKSTTNRRHWLTWDRAGRSSCWRGQPACTYSSPWPSGSWRRPTPPRGPPFSSVVSKSLDVNSAHPGATSSMTLVHCRDTGYNATDADILFERLTYTEVHEADNSVENLRAISSRGNLDFLYFARLTISLANVHTHPRNCSPFTQATRRQFPPYSYRELFTRKRIERAGDVSLHAIIHTKRTVLRSVLLTDWQATNSETSSPRALARWLVRARATPLANSCGDASRTHHPRVAKIN